MFLRLDNISNVYKDTLADSTACIVEARVKGAKSSMSNDILTIDNAIDTPPIYCFTVTKKTQLRHVECSGNWAEGKGCFFYYIIIMFLLKAIWFLLLFY